jgi:Ca2+-binding RTX toxin-like protein
MATHTIKSDFTKTFEIKTSNDEWTFTKDFSVDADNYGIFIDSQYMGNTILIDGQVHGNKAAIVNMADDTMFTLGSTAKVTGKFGIAVIGDNVSIINDGKVVSTADAIYGVGSNHLTFTNENFVKGAEAVYLRDGTRMINAEGATVAGNSYGVNFNDGSSGEASLLINHGTITATQTAIKGDHARLTVINDGTISGTIYLGSGTSGNRFDNRGGVIINDDSGVRGGLGSDILITDSAKVKLIEEADAGIHDTVRSTVSYHLSSNVENLVLLGTKGTNAIGTDTENVLHGNSGDNHLKGLLGIDELYGHKGTDILTGGGDGDLFHFSTGDGHDTITDFENGLDRADISGWKAISDFDDLMQHHIAFENGDAIITAGTDSLTLKGVAEADLDAGDFVFGT